MDDLPFPLKLAEVCLHLSYSDEKMSGDISVALSQAHKELTAQHNTIEALQARVAAARRDAFEEAAKVADHIMRDYAELTYSPHHDRMQNAAKTYCAGEIAAAIRALAEKG